MCPLIFICLSNGPIQNRPNPQNSRGGRDLDCPHYEDCLNLAARLDWQAFHCEDCLLSITLFNLDAFYADPDEERELNDWEPWTTAQSESFDLWSFPLSD